MRRRDFLGVMASATAAWPVNALRAAPGKVYRLAFASPSQPLKEMTEVGFLQTFFKELRRLGYVEGENLVISRFTTQGDPTRYDSMIEEVIRATPDVVVAANNPLILRFKSLMKSTPLVALMGDPVAWGIVPSLSQPGGNITGISADAGEELWGKRLAMLVEAFPAARRVGFLSTAPFWDSPQGSMVREAAQRSSVNLVAPPLQGMYQEPEYHRVFEEFHRENADVLLVSDASENLAHISLILDLVQQARLPALYPYREFVTMGGLMAYAFDVQDMFSRAAHYVDMILKGTKPNEIPIYQADKFITMVNLKTAKKLGVTIPATLLSRADEVIE